MKKHTCNDKREKLFYQNTAKYVEELVQFKGGFANHLHAK